MICCVFVLQELAQLGDERVDILELAVDRSETDIGHIVDLLETFHDQLADLSRTDLPLHLVLEYLLDLTDHIFQGGVGDRALFAGADQTGHDLVAVKTLTAAVLFDYHKRQTLHSLVSSKTLFTGQAFPAAADACTLLSRAGINDFAFRVGTERTSHVRSTSQLSTVENNLTYYTTLK